MNDIRVARPVPGWFWVVAALALLFMAFGCLMYYTQVSADPSTLPLDQRSMWEATPTWMVAAYAIAVWVGLAGTILLLLRRRHSVLLLLISLIAVVVQFGGILVVPDLREMVPSSAYAAPIVIIVITYGIWHFSRYAQKRGWLR